MSMQLFFIIVTIAGSLYLFVRERGGRRFAIGALAAPFIGLLQQLDAIKLRGQYVWSIIWAVIAICAAILWLRVGKKSGITVASAMTFVATLTLALSLGLLR